MCVCVCVLYILYNYNIISDLMEKKIYIYIYMCLLTCLFIYLNGKFHEVDPLSSNTSVFPEMHIMPGMNKHLLNE